MVASLAQMSMHKATEGRSERPNRMVVLVLFAAAAITGVVIALLWDNSIASAHG